MPTAGRNVALATLAYVTGLATHMTLAYYLAPIALREGSGASSAWVFSGVAVAMMVAVVPAGRLADRVPRRHVLAAGLAAQGIAAGALMLAPQSFAAILAMTALTGAGLGLIVVSFNSYVADVLASAEIAGAFGRTSALSTLLSAAGPLVASLAFRGDALGGVRLASAFFVLLPIAGALLALRLPSARPTGHAPAARPTAKPAWRREARVVVPIMIMYVVLGAGYGMSSPYFTTWFLDRMSDQAWGVVLAAGTIANAVGALLLVSLAPWVGDRRTLFVSQLVLALACAAFILPLGIAILAVAYLLRNLAANFSPITNARLARSVRPTSRAQAQGYGSLAWNVGWATGAAFGGAMLAALGSRSFAVGGAMSLAGTMVGLVLLGAEPAGNAGNAGTG